MKFELGVKSDPVEYRYSYEWLFRLMQEQGVTLLQLGSFFELYSLPDAYFVDLRNLAEKFNIRIKSVFTAHRELGGFFSSNKYMEAVARKNYERLIAVASLLGADFAGSNPGAVYRDCLSDKKAGLARYVSHIKELSQIAKLSGLRALTMEPMSCLAEPPTIPDEIGMLMTELAAFHKMNIDSSVPVYLCGDVSHGYADIDRTVIHRNIELFEFGIPWMCEFHFKNTDRIYNSTFGFTKEERERGIVDVAEIVSIVQKRASDWPVKTVTGYLEIGGPKLGRDYSDHLLGNQLVESLQWINGCIQEKKA